MLPPKGLKLIYFTSLSFGFSTGGRDFELDAAAGDSNRSSLGFGQPQWSHDSGFSPSSLYSQHCMQCQRIPVGRFLVTVDEAEEGTSAGFSGTAACLLLLFLT